MAGVDGIDDANIGLGRVLTVQTAGILLQRPLPRNGHCQDKGVEWRVVESFADQFAGGQQHARCIRGQSVQLVNQFGT